jgi:replicative DNA helicase
VKVIDSSCTWPVLNIFVIDYLELLHSTARRAENRLQEIADISSRIKALAKGTRRSHHRFKPIESEFERE